jgi:hypothetical protein
VHDREKVVPTHRGNDRQREWLRTQEPFGDWDFLYPASDLGTDADGVLAAIKTYLRSSS